MGRIASSTKERAQVQTPESPRPVGSGPAAGLLSASASEMEPLGSAQLIEFYRLMYASRRIDDREIMLKRQQKIFFQISAAGHEALQIGRAHV